MGHSAHKKHGKCPYPRHHQIFARSKCVRSSGYVKWVAPGPGRGWGGGQNSRYPASIFVSNKSKQAFLQKPKGRENRAASATSADLQENFFGNLKKVSFGINSKIN